MNKYRRLIYRYAATTTCKTLVVLCLLLAAPALQPLHAEGNRKDTATTSAITKLLSHLNVNMPGLEKVKAYKDLFLFQFIKYLTLL